MEVIRHQEILYIYRSFQIVSGYGILKTVSTEGKEQGIALITPGFTLSISFLKTDNFFIHALTDMQLEEVREIATDRCIASQQLCIQFLMLRKHLKVQDRMLDLFKVLASLKQSLNIEVLPFKFTHELFAELTGTTRVSVTRCLHDLENADMLKISKRRYIFNGQVL